MSKDDNTKKNPQSYWLKRQMPISFSQVEYGCTSEPTFTCIKTKSVDNVQRQVEK